MYILRQRISRLRGIYDTYFTGSIRMLGAFAPVTSFDKDKAKVFETKGDAEQFRDDNLTGSWKVIPITKNKLA